MPRVVCLFLIDLSLWDEVFLVSDWLIPWAKVRGRSGASHALLAGRGCLLIKSGGEGDISRPGVIKICGELCPQTRLNWDPENVMPLD